jgi:hypothetical protein
MPEGQGLIIYANSLNNNPEALMGSWFERLAQPNVQTNLPCSFGLKNRFMPMRNRRTSRISLVIRVNSRDSWLTLMVQGCSYICAICGQTHGSWHLLQPATGQGQRGLTEPAALQGLNRLDVMQRAHGSQEVFIMER